MNLLTGDGLNRSTQDNIDDSFLVAAYLAWAFQQIRRSMQTRYDKVFLNMAAPMSHVENPILKEKYLRIVQAAWNLSFAKDSPLIMQGISVKDLSRYLLPQLAQPVQPKEIRQFEVLPETIAPVVSLSLDPWMKSGMYMIVDTGAGTTEFSVFHAGDPGANQKILCYRDETLLIGGNALTRPTRADRSLSEEQILKAVSEIENNYRCVWQKGYQLDRPNHTARIRWQELTLVLSGGGTRNTLLGQTLRNANPIYPWPADDTRFEVCRHRPGTLEMRDSMDDEEFSMFAVANGLALDRSKWPIVFQPNEIEALVPTEEVENKPQGYWYLDAK